MNQTSQRRVAVVTDSTAYIPQELVDAHDIHVVPLHLMMGENTWLDGVEIDPPAFYEKLRVSPDFPSTSQPNVAAFQELFLELSKDHEGIVAVLISSELSGTVASATGAAANLPDLAIEVIDSQATAMMLGFPVLEAAKVAAAGGDLQAVTDRAKEIAAKSHIYFVVDTLEYLHRGGRIGGAAKLLGSALNLKPILELSDGKVTPVTKVRTQRKALAKTYDLLREQIAEGDKVHMSVLNVAALEAAERFRDELVARFDPVEITMTEASPAIGAHVGPGTVGVSFYVE
jgi:DegV family protein with EDD domain